MIIFNCGFFQKVTQGFMLYLYEGNCENLSLFKLEKRTYLPHCYSDRVISKILNLKNRG